MPLRRLGPTLAAWERLYLYDRGRLPWLDAEVPDDLLRQLFDAMSPPRRVLDFGCGSGRLSQVLDRWGGLVVAADCSVTALRNAVALEAGVYLRSASLRDFALSQFEGLLLWGVLHHHHHSEWERWLRLALSTLRPGGLLLMGNVSSADPAFRGRFERVSRTTKLACYAALEPEVMQRMLDASGLVSISCGDVTLADGVTQAIRTWRFDLLERPRLIGG